MGHVYVWFVLLLNFLHIITMHRMPLANCTTNIICIPGEIAQAGSQTVTNTKNKYHYPAFWSQMELTDLEVAGFYCMSQESHDKERLNIRSIKIIADTMHL